MRRAIQLQEIAALKSDIDKGLLMWRLVASKTLMRRRSWSAGGSY